MTNSGEIAEQMVRMSLEGVEVAAKITGSAAKEIAVLLLAAMKNNSKNNLKLKGKARLSSMLKSGRSLEIFSVKEGDLRTFMQGAKQYGVVYCVLKNTQNSPDGLCDVLVKADDAPKISRLVERFKLATVEKAKVESEIVSEKGEKTADNTEKLLDELLGAEKKNPSKEAENRPFPDSPPKANPFELTSENRAKTARGTQGKPSVKAEIRDITAEIAGKTKNQPLKNIKEKFTNERV